MLTRWFWLLLVVFKYSLSSILDLELRTSKPFPSIWKYLYLLKGVFPKDLISNKSFRYYNLVIDYLSTHLYIVDFS